MEYTDKTLSCRDCQQAFTFTVGEQEFYAQKNLVNEPSRCSNCRVTRKLIREGKGVEYSSEHPCHECGEVTRVPFKPIGAKPVYCQNCLQKQKTQT